MIIVEDWAEIRRLHKVEKLSERAIARRLGLHRETVRGALAKDEPPSYHREVRQSVLEPYKPKIHALLGRDHDLSGVRIFEIIQEEGYTGQVSLLRAYLRRVRPEYRPRAVYQRTSYEAGEYGQVDWGEMPEPVLWQGQWCKVYAFVMVLCYSRLMYLEFSLSSQLADFLRCHQNGLRFLGGSAKIWVYDNLTSVVRQRRGKEIRFNETFSQFAGYYLFRPYACWPGSPHQKGVVERPMDYIQRNFWAGRNFADFSDLVGQGRRWQDGTANAREHRITRQEPRQLFEAERSQLVALPAEPFDTAWILYPRVSKDCVVRVQTNDYSVPWEVAQRHRRLEVRVEGEWVRLRVEGQEIACHARCYGRHQQILNPQHYAGLHQHQPGAAFARLEQGFLNAYGEVGRRFYDGLGRKTERLQSALQAIVRLESRYPHADIVAALTLAVDHHYFDSLAVEYLLRVVSLNPGPVPPTPTLVTVTVEERPLAGYDRFSAEVAHAQ
ncbi:MAG: IS21 family transposase [Chloroflexi bacterium]|nr:IS21 family transposase [Chloroflexota bacterium]